MFADDFTSLFNAALEVIFSCMRYGLSDEEFAKFINKMVGHESLMLIDCEPFKGEYRVINENSENLWNLIFEFNDSHSNCEEIQDYNQNNINYNNYNYNNKRRVSHGLKVRIDESNILSEKDENEDDETDVQTDDEEEQESDYETEFDDDNDETQTETQTEIQKEIQTQTQTESQTQIKIQKQSIKGQGRTKHGKSNASNESNNDKKQIFDIFDNNNNSQNNINKSHQKKKKKDSKITDINLRENRVSSVIVHDHET